MAVEGCLPLSSLLSQVLVAFTIEFDNEFERQTPHRTSDYGSTPGAPHNAPWLVSMVMWSTFMRFVRDEGTPVSELQRLTGLDAKGMTMWITRMNKWWDYIVVEAEADGKVVRATTGGRKAQAVWRPLAESIEKRWQERFGKQAVDELYQSLAAVALRLDADLPDRLPILSYGLFSAAPNGKRPKSSGGFTHDARETNLAGLLSKVLLAFALDFERGSEVSLAISANVLRLAGTDGVRVKDLPRTAGVSKEAIGMSISFLEKRGYAVSKAEPPGSRAKTLTLTDKGNAARAAYDTLIWEIEERWHTRLGREAIRRLRTALEQLVGAQDEPSRLFRGVEPYPDGWRAAVQKPLVLPHYPMVLHRGGFPDGS